ncbi:hypothetical protein AB0M54_46325 [Actinoplanes sp. NPDC051470]|uniref:hypothetical protein n=1 Tax=Actinoplanes sp. NPDC051470 TaxID=3157224 RepID=UPI0034349878
MSIQLWEKDWTFRHLLETGARSALDAAGFAGRINAYLVGLPVDDQDIATVERRTSSNRDDPKNITSRLRLDAIEAIVQDLGGSEPQDRADRRYSLALEQHLNYLHSGLGWHYFVAPQSARIADRYVYGVLGVAEDELYNAPAHYRFGSDGKGHEMTLAQCVVQHVLEQSALYLAADYQGYSASGLAVRKFEILRTAAARFVAAALDPTGFKYERDGDILLSRISALPYEGREGQGSITIADPEDPFVEPRITIEPAVPVTDLQAVRKLMEATSPSIGLLMHQQRIFGLGGLRSEESKATSVEHTTIRFTGRGTWQLWQGDRMLLRVKDGLVQQGSLADSPIDTELPEVIDWLMPEADTVELQRLARAAARNRHGAMLVIAADAEQEAQRLMPQAWRTVPAVLDNELTEQLTAMDGAILVDMAGRCHAIGVILDGVAAGAGNPGRGSRYNNPVRYLGTARAGGLLPRAITVIYSTDGAVNVLPERPRKVDRKLIDHLVQRLCHHAEVSHPDLYDLGVTVNSLIVHRFYLLANDCDNANRSLSRLYESLSDWPERRILTANFRPDDRMSPSKFYFSS